MKVRIKNQKKISAQEMEEMYEIYKSSYHIPYAEFLRKKESIDAYAFYYAPSGELVGFTGIRDQKVRAEKTKYRCFYIGQTMILPEFRGKSLIQRTVVKLFFSHYLRTPFRKVIVWNDSLTYRPFLVIAKGVKHFHPSPHEHNPSLEKVRNILGKKYYGDSYDGNTGIVRKQNAVLTSSELNISARKLDDPYVQFFISQNPKYYEGNGLITLCPASFKNMFYYLNTKFSNPRNHRDVATSRSLSA